MPLNLTVRAALLGAAIPLAAHASPAATPLVTAPVSDAHLTVLTASVPGAAAAASDAGALAAGTPLAHVQVLLKRPAARQAALDALVTAQTTPGSPSYHRWLTPAELKADYGPAQADIDATARWLAAKGLTVNRVSATGMSIDISGNAATLGAAFHTALHAYDLAGEAHLGPSTAPAVPAALAPVVAGVTLSNFFPRPALSPLPAAKRAALAGATIRRVGTSYTATIKGVTFYAVTPADFATIYHENQAFTGAPVINGARITGKGQTVIVDEQTDIRPADWNSFRSTFGLSGYKGTLTLTHPGGCADPGFTPDEGEAALDAEWSSANAPDAAIVEASCAGTATTFGVETTLQNLVETSAAANAAAISISYGGCEQNNGLTFQQGWNNLVEEGASEGIPIFVSAGDSAVAVCERNQLAVDGLAVNGLASPIYVTAIGGTDFYDTALGEDKNYWSATNAPGGGSALSYIPEIPWDNSCANVINYRYVGEPGPIINCNLKTLKAGYQETVGGSGGQSLLYAKPDYQSTGLPGMPNDGVRDLPDISLFAANGFWNHFYLECMSDPAEGGVPCDYTNPNDFLGSAFGGTSFGSPDFAGIAALVAQYKGYRSGNFAPRLYQIAQLQFTNPTLVETCNATKGASVSPFCVFNDVTAGDNATACTKGSPNCAVNANATQGIGVLSATGSTRDPAFPSTPGYDLATGLGTVNVTNLILNY